MNVNDERFFELAMKVIARQATDAERAELDARLASEPALRGEFERLEADVRVAKEALPLVNAAQAAAGELPAYARGRLQTKVREALGRSETAGDTTREQESSVMWRWVLGLTAGTAVIAFVTPLVFRKQPENAPQYAVDANRSSDTNEAIRLPQPQSEPAVEDMALDTTDATHGSGTNNLELPEQPHPKAAVLIAMLDVLGTTRGGGANENEVALLQQTWANAKLDSFAKPELLRAWETNWPAKADTVKIIYDRNAAEVRVLGRWHGKAFQNAFPVETDLALALTRAQAFIQEQSKP